jgi:hypothetical protein
VYICLCITRSILHGIWEEISTILISVLMLIENGYDGETVKFDNYSDCMEYPKFLQRRLTSTAIFNGFALNCSSPGGINYMVCGSHDGSS